MLDLNQRQRARSIYGSFNIGYFVFGGREHQKMKDVLMLLKITGERVKFNGSKYIQENLINMSLQLYISYFPEQTS